MSINWTSLHSDAWHPGTRDNCNHCQAMIAAFGPMPSIEEILSSVNPSTTACRKKELSQRTRWIIFQRDSFTCKTCGSMTNLTVDHIIPESKGGSSDPENLQTLCKSCNSKKGVRV